MRRPKVSQGAWIMKISAPGWWYGEKMVQGLATGIAAQVELGMAETVTLRTVMWELVQNGVLHGNGGSESLPLTVKACWDGLQLQVTVEDGGEGFTRLPPEEERGLAQAEKLLGGQLVFEEGGKRAVFWLPVEKSE